MDPNKISNTSEHLANERTFLAWVRTSIGIMAFGFVVVKFSLFVKQIGIALGKEIQIQQHGHSNIIGILLVAVGSGSLMLSFIQFKSTERQINNSDFRYSSRLVGALAVLIFLISLFLIAYLINNI